MATNEELIGRTDINDLEAILSITNTDVDEVTHAVAFQGPCSFSSVSRAPCTGVLAGTTKFVAVPSVGVYRVYPRSYAARRRKSGAMVPTSANDNWAGR